MNNVMVILDNGHGVTTPGKRSPQWTDGKQLFEWSYCREIVTRIHDKLCECGIASTIIVPESADVPLSSRANRANEIVAKYGASNCIFISVHANAGGGRGFEVFSTTKRNKSDVLAQCFVDACNETFPDRKNRGHKECDFTVIYKTNCPAVLTENFFYDNEEECHFMLTEDCKSRIVEMHVNAIKKYINK